MPVVAEEIRKVCNEKVSAKELERAKTQLKASMLMGLESSSSSAEVLARQMLLFDRVIPVEEMVSRVEKVSLEDIQNAAIKILPANLLTLCSAQSETICPMTSWKNRSGFRNGR